MKKLMLLMMFLCLASVAAMAQDIIVKKDGTTIKAKVEKVTDSVIEYKIFSNLTGRTYTIEITDLLAINYEDGKLKTFSNSGTSVTNETLVNTGERRLTDAQLLELSRLKRVKPEKSEKIKKPEKIYTSEELYKKGKRNKTYGLYIGGALIVSGAITASMCAVVGTPERKGSYDYSAFDGCLFGGISMMGLGAAIGIPLICVGQHKINKAKAIQSTSLYQFDTLLNSNARLTADVNLIKDNLTRQYAPGLGFHINF